MLEFLIVFIALWFIIALLTLVHELGHAIAALAFTEGPVSIELGTTGTPRSVHLGRLIITVRFFSTSFGSYRFTNRPARTWQHVAICIAGPVTSLLCACIAIGLLVPASTAPTWTRAILFWTAIFAAIQFLATIIPFRYPGGWPGYAGMDAMAKGH